MPGRHACLLLRLLFLVASLDAVAGASYQLAPRAQIFRRDAPGVDTLPALKALLRSNKWPDEPVRWGRRGVGLKGGQKAGLCQQVSCG